MKLSKNLDIKKCRKSKLLNIFELAAFVIHNKTTANLPTNYDLTILITEHKYAPFERKFAFLICFTSKQQ